MKQQKTLTTLVLTLILFTTTLTTAQLYYNIQLEYNNPNLEIKNIDVIFSQQDLTFTQGNHYLKLTSFNNQQITTTNFTIPNIQIYDNTNESGQITTGGTIILNKTTFNLYIPYNQDAKQLTIYNQQNQELTTSTLTHLSQNQQATQIINNQKTTQETPTQTLQPESDTGWKILLWISIILIIILIIFLTRKRKSKNI